MKAHCCASILLKTLNELKDKESICVKESEERYKPFADSLNRQFIDIYETYGIDIIGTTDDREVLGKFIDNNFLRKNNKVLEYDYNTDKPLYLTENISVEVQDSLFFITHFADTCSGKHHIREFKTHHNSGEYCAVFRVVKNTKEEVLQPNEQFATLIEKVEAIVNHPAITDIILEEEDLNLIRSIENLTKHIESK